LISISDETLVNIGRRNHRCITKKPHLQAFDINFAKNNETSRS